MVAGSCSTTAPGPTWPAGSRRCCCHEYDNRGDVLYVSVGPPREAARTVATPEGHALDYDESGAVIGMVVVNVRFLLERDGALTVTMLPDRVAAAQIEPALVAV
jgi:uncharacterized protein YuzE